MIFHERFAWSDASCELAKSMVLQGKPIAEVGKAVGCSISTVMKAKRRYGWRRKLGPGRRPALMIVRMMMRQRARAAIEERATLGLSHVFLAQQPGEGVTLDELGPRQCHWPLGLELARTTHFCGEKTEACMIYCPYHHGLSRRQTDSGEEI